MRPEVKITLSYLLFASIWIIGSDMVVGYSESGQIKFADVQTFKGLYFVMATGLLLFIVLGRTYNGWRQSETRRFTALHAASERYRKLSARVQNLREEERTRISREIHDELGQLLTGIKMQLRIVEDRLSNRNDRSLNQSIDQLVEASSMIDQTIDSVKRISSGLRPIVLDDLGLAAALSQEAEQFSLRTGITVNLSFGEMQHAIPTKVETTAFRIFQELLTNVARHANATTVSPEVSITNGILTLKVRDDGIGIDPDIIEKPSSLGLIGMLERATSAGGTLNFQSSSCNGTQVVLTIPLRETAQPAEVP